MADAESLLWGRFIGENDGHVEADEGAGILKLLPFVRRVGNPQKVTVCYAAPTPDGAVPGLMYIWEGTNPDGLKVRASLMMTIFNKQRIVLVSLGDKAKVMAREEVLKDVFSSLMP